MTQQLAGRRIVITGAASGIGRAAALACAREGAAVVVSDVAASGEDVAREITASGGRAVFVACDVTDSGQVAALMQSAAEALGGLDGAFNNAGIEGELHPLAEYPEELVRRVLDVNVLGVWRCMREQAPRMIECGGGSIVNTSSVAGLIGAAAFSAYVASKHAVVGLTKSAAIEYARAGIRVNAVCPGIIETPMLERLAAQREGLVEGLLALKPMGRLGTAAEVAEAVAWLLSERASFVTGQTVAVDGGYVAQ